MLAVQGLGTNSGLIPIFQELEHLSSWAFADGFLANQVHLVAPHLAQELHSVPRIDEVLLSGSNHQCLPGELFAIFEQEFHLQVLLVEPLTSDELTRIDCWTLTRGDRSYCCFNYCSFCALGLGSHTLVLFG